MSTNGRRALVFFSSLVGYCTLFMWPWAPLEAAFSRGFAAFGNALIRWSGGQMPGQDSGGAAQPTSPANAPKVSGILGTPATGMFISDHQGDRQHDLRIQLVNIPKGLAGRKDFLGQRRTSSRHLAYMPAVTLIALVLATPIPWRRKPAALLIGLTLIAVFVVVRLAVVLIDGFRGDEPHCLFQLQPLWAGLFDLGARIVAVEPATTYLAPLLIWLVVTVRREDLTTWLGLPSPEPTASAAPRSSRQAPAKSTPPRSRGAPSSGRSGKARTR